MLALDELDPAKADTSLVWELVGGGPARGASGGRDGSCWPAQQAGVGGGKGGELHSEMEVIDLLRQVGGEAPPHLLAIHLGVHRALPLLALRPAGAALPHEHGSLLPLARLCCRAGWGRAPLYDMLALGRCWVFWSWPGW